MLKRLFPTRWARIMAWTAAALSWGTTAVAVAAGGPEATEASTDPEPTLAPSQIVAATTTVAPLPSQPQGGLVVLRFTPVEPPPPEVITRTVTVASGGGGSAPAPTVSSSGS
jgi:hypothetical protein